MPRVCKRYAAIILLSVSAIALPLLKSTISAQTATGSANPTPLPSSPTPTLPPFPANRALSDYVYNYDQYKQAYGAYLVAKNEYQTYGTLVSQQKALDTTRSMLSWREDVTRTYLLALRQELQETPGLASSDRDPVTASIDIQVQWVETQKTSLPSAATLNDLLALSQTFEGRYPLIQQLYYQALSLIVIGRQSDTKSKVVDQVNQIKSKIATLSNSGTPTQTYERWLLEAQTRLDRSQEQTANAQTLLSTITTQNNSQIFSQIQGDLSQSNVYLQDALNMVSEIIREAANAGL